MIREAPAKLNLYLHVLARRGDGYHLLDSLIVFAGIADRLAVAPADELSLAIEGPFAGALGAAGDDNLVLRAARRLAAATATAAGASIRLTKNLPVAAGLGGGSADAAAALAALAELWGVAPDPATLAGIALELGADVPACLYGAPAFVGGIGEAVAPAPPLPPAWVVLANPAVPLATEAVFRARTGAWGAPARFCEAARDVERLAALLAERQNQLEPAARRLVPAIGAVLGALSDQPGCRIARLSGSGPTCFGLFAGEAEAAAAARRIAEAAPRWWVAAAPLLARPAT